jgi:RNA polymerase sigma factor (TIGR02999 family)
MGDASGEITTLLARVSAGQKEAIDDLMPIVYAELRKVAARCIAVERPGHTLQPTALVHEVYFRLVGQKEIEWKNRAQFFAISAQIMRRVLLDYARRHQALKRGGLRQKITLDENMAIAVDRLSDFIVLDEALSRLAAVDPDQARLVELRFFGGLTVEQTAHVLGISTATVKREWSSARAWLRKEMAKANGDEAGAIAAG